MTASTFDFDAFRRAFEGKQAEAWISFYADDAEWVEYKPTAPPRSPVVMAGRDAIAAFLTAVCDSPLELALSDEVLGADRAAFRVTCTFPDGRRVLEHVIVEHRDGLIRRQVDVESWD